MTQPQQIETSEAEAGATSTAVTPGLVPGRDCGTCSMCCKVFRVVEVDKAPGQWCRHIVHGQGCGIHATRPGVCRTFFCFWLQNKTLGPEWKPERSKFVLYTEMEGRRLVVASDAASPTAWRKAPYYAQFKRWAVQGAASNRQILVFHGTRATAVLPDRDVELGTLDIGDKVIYHAVGDRIEVEHRRQASPLLPSREKLPDRADERCVDAAPFSPGDPSFGASGLLLPQGEKESNLS